MKRKHQNRDTITQAIRSAYLWSPIFQLINKYSNGIVLILLPFILLLIHPVALASNVGYIDPNYYIGYAENYKWLIDTGGFNYPATRLLLILVVKFCLLFGSKFGLAYKYILDIYLGLCWNLICNKFRMSKRSFFYGLAILELIPIEASITSWTMPDGFASIFGLGIIVWAFVTKNNWISFFIFGFLSTSILISNAFIGFIYLLLSGMIIILRNSRRDTILIGCKVLFAFLSWALLYELFWKIFFPHARLMSIGNNKTLNFHSGLWQAQLSSSVGISKNSFYKSFSELSRVGTNLNLFWCLLILGGLLPLLSLCFSVVRRRHLNMSYHSVEFSLLFFSCLIFFTYQVGLNPGFSFFWYYYSNMPIFFLATLLILKSLDSSTSYKGSLIFMLAFLGYVDNIRLNVFILNVSSNNLVKLMLLGTCVYGVLHIVFREKYLVALILVFTFSGGLHLIDKIPQFTSGLNSSGNFRNILFLKDEIFVQNRIATIPTKFNSVSTWVHENGSNSGWLGSIQSSIWYNQFRLENLGQPVFPADPKLMRNRTSIPRYLIALENPYTPRALQKFLQCGFENLNKYELPSHHGYILILREVASKSNC